MSNKGDTARTTKDKIQLAENAITRPAAIVAMFCTIRAKVSPTRVLTVEASVDNLELTAPLQGMFISLN